jgi:hypothetical protein
VSGNNESDSGNLLTGNVAGSGLLKPTNLLWLLLGLIVIGYSSYFVSKKYNKKK